MFKNRVKILVAESGGFPDGAARLLQRAGDVVFADLDRNGLLSAVADAHVLWVRLRHKIDLEVFEAGKYLKAIVSPTTGVNHIAFEEAERRRVTVLSLRGEADFLRDVRSTAEHTLALIFMLLRNLPDAVNHVRSGGWNRDLFKGRELYGKTVGIVGYGRLGRIVTQYLKVFGARVLVTDPTLDPRPVEQGVDTVDLFQLLQESDIVTLHVNLNKETSGFFGHDEFAAMKQSAWFINTSRGELVNEMALLKSLQSGHLVGAALDVLCGEDSQGMNDHPLVAYSRNHSNLLITPHLGGCTVESLAKTEVFMAEKLWRFLSAPGKNTHAQLAH